MSHRLLCMACNSSKLIENILHKQTTFTEWQSRMSDELTLFKDIISTDDIQFNYSVNISEIEKIIGINIGNMNGLISCLCCATNHSKIQVDVDSESALKFYNPISNRVEKVVSPVISFTVNSPDFRDLSMFIFKHNNRLVLYTNLFFPKMNIQGKGISKYLITRQIYKALEFGVDYISCQAIGYTESQTGYYWFPSTFGFDKKFNKKEKELFYNNGDDNIKTLQQLIKNEGINYWKMNGTTIRLALKLS